MVRPDGCLLQCVEHKNVLLAATPRRVGRMQHEPGAHESARRGILPDQAREQGFLVTAVRKPMPSANQVAHLPGLRDGGLGDGLEVTLGI